MRIENELILCCARTELENSTKARICELVREDIDWDLLVSSAERFGVKQLVFINLVKTCAELVPDDVVRQLRIFSYKNVSRNVLFVEELGKILQSFKENGVLAVPFKGPVLAETVYGDIGLRVFCDLDILVSEHQVVQASKVLVANGYFPELSLNSEQLLSYAKTEDNLLFTADNQRPVVELHWELSGRYLAQPFTLEMIKERLEEVSLSEYKVLNLSPSDLLVYLSLHGLKHNWDRLEWICCVAELLKTEPRIDWDQVFRLTKILQCKRILLLGVALVVELFQVEIPLQIENEIRNDKNVKFVSEKVIAGLFGETKTLVGREAGLSSMHMKMQDSCWAILRYYFRLLTCPTKAEWRSYPLPALWSGFHYVLRPLRLIWEYGRRKMGL